VLRENGTAFRSSYGGSPRCRRRLGRDFGSDSKAVNTRPDGSSKDPSGLWHTDTGEIITSQSAEPRLIGRRATHATNATSKRLTASFRRCPG
jgi:hypothetical protein